MNPERKRMSEQLLSLLSSQVKSAIYFSAEYNRFCIEIYESRLVIDAASDEGFELLKSELSNILKSAEEVNGSQIESGEIVLCKGSTKKECSETCGEVRGCKMFEF